MKTFNRDTGRLAENLAAKHLQDKGYDIIEQNFSNRFGEIDIIAKDPSASSGPVLVFVEVKAKRGVDFGLPEEMVGKGKLQKIRNMATVYNSGKEVPCRIDVVAVILSPDNEIVRLTHYENVY